MKPAPGPVHGKVVRRKPTMLSFLKRGRTDNAPGCPGPDIETAKPAFAAPGVDGNVAAARRLSPACRP